MRKFLRLQLKTVLLLVALVTGVDMMGQMTFTSGAGLTQTQNFNGLPTNATNNNINTARIGHNWYRATGSTVTQSLNSNVVTGQNTNSLSHGVYNCASTAASTDRAVGVVASGSGSHTIGVELKNTTGSGISSFTISGNVEKYRNGSSSVVTERVFFSYSIDATSLVTGTWTAVTALDLVEPNNNTTQIATGVDGNLALNKAAFSGEVTLGTVLANDGSVWIRWSDTEESGSDALLALDDVSITATLQATGPTITTTAASFGPFCNASDNDITLAYTASGTFTGTYRIQRSNAGGTFPNDVTSNLLTTVSSGTGTITATFPSNGLATGNYRVRVINTDPATQGTDNGSDIVVSSQSPTISTAAGLSGLATTSMVVRGVNGAGVCNPITERGFVYSSTDTTPTNGEAGVLTAAATFGTGAYILQLTGLTPSTTYYYRAYILSGSSYFYGGVMNETTEAPVPILTITGPTTNHDSVCVNTAGTPVEYTITNSSTVAATGVTVVSGGTYSSMFAVSGLSSTTIAGDGGTATYTVIFTPTSTGPKNAFMTVTSVTAGSNSPQSYLTGTGINTATSITTAAASAITATSATLGGNVTIEGCSPVTDRGVVIGTSSNPVINGTGVTKLGSGSGAGDFTVASGAILSPSTLYYVRAYAINSLGATVYGTQVNFTTPCVASALPFSEGFDAVSFPPACWTSFRGANNVGTAEDWKRVTTNTYNSSAGAAQVQWENNTGTNNLGQDWLVTPAIEIPAAGAELTFQARRQYTDPGTFYVKISTTSQTSISGFSTDLLTLNGSSFADNTYFLQTIDLQAYAGQTVYLAFVSEQDNGPSWWIDDIHIEAGVLVPTLSTNGTTALTFGEEGITEESASQTFNVSGTTLSGAPGVITVASDSTDFEVSADNITFSPSINIPYASETLTSTPVFVRFAPETTGAKSGTLTISGGGAATSPTVALTGTGIIPAPVATAATEISNRKFRANWNTVDIADSYRLDVMTAGENIVASDLIISEYIEGSGNNKALEIFNGTGAAVNLSAYSLKQQNGGSGAFGASAPYVLQLPNVSLADGDVYVICSDGANATIKAQADLQMNFNTASGGRVVHFNGDDAVGLYKNDVQIDLVGIANSATVWGEDKTLVRNPAILSPSTTYDAGDWTSYASDTFTYIGSHTFDGGTSIEYVAGYENLLVEGPSQLVTGLEPNTLYTYRVRTVAGAEASGHSNTIDVTTTNFNTWDGAAWSLVTPPTVADNAIIEGDYNTGEEAPIEALNLTVDSGELTVAAETVVTVANALTVGNGTVVVESNGMLMQAGTTNQNSGAVEVHRDSHPLYRGDYTMWSAPVAGQNVFNFSNGTVLSRFYTYNTTTNHFESMFASPEDTGGVTFAAGQGYLIRMPNGSDVPGYIAGTAPMTFDGEFTGVPNNGDIPVTLSADGLGFNAIGNPYPSMIDADEFLQRNAIDNQRIDGTLYFWRKKNGVEGDAYATYTYVGGAAGSGTPGSSDDPELEEPILTEVPNGRIQTGQGFLVKALMGGSQPLFANTLRMADFSQDDQFFRMANTTGVVKHRMWLNLKNPAGLVFQSLVGYMTGATNGLDAAIDGKRFDEAAAGFYSVADAAKLTIQGRALPFMASDVVPMGFKALTAGSHTITLSNMDGLFAEGQDIFLKDNVLGVTHNLKEAGYTFATEAGTFDERFEIVYAQALGTDTPVLDANSIVVYKQGNAINISSGTIEMTGVAVYDIQGRELYSKTGINSTEAVITNLQSAQQVLIVQITTAKNGKVSKKIVF